jgi:hypothetical protein
MSLLKTLSFNVNNFENTSNAIQLIASGGNGNYRFIIENDVIYGVLSEVKNNKVIYTPNKNYVGKDFFTYKCTDEITTSEPSTVYINNIGNAILSGGTMNANIFETSVITINPVNFNLEDPITYTILNPHIGLVIQNTNKILLKNIGSTQILCKQNNSTIYIQLNVYFLNKKSITYNLYSPQLAYNINSNKYYRKQIKETNKIINADFKPYNPIYFQTSYDRILTPNIVTIPY